MLENLLYKDSFAMMEITFPQPYGGAMTLYILQQNLHVLIFPLQVYFVSHSISSL